MDDSFLFYDLETFGSDPRRTRIAQFAAIRTDAELREIEEPTSFFVQPADDLLPSPGAAMVTGITPQQAQRDGVNEAEAFARIQEAMARPRTCTAGYNSLRFDDEFIRFGLYRNFFDPYEREWRSGNSRWDLLDAMRLMHALRPDGISWRAREDGGGTSFRLEHLAEDNGLRVGEAHEALSDVRALIGLARRFRQAQPRLWDYALGLRDKRRVGALLDCHAQPILLHVSQRYPASRLCAAPVLPLVANPRINGRVIVFDLESDPTELIALPHEEIARRLFVRREDLPDGVERIALKEIHANKCPAVVQWDHLRRPDFDRLGIDADRVRQHAAQLRTHAHALAEKLRRVFATEAPTSAVDADAALYAGFLSDADRAGCIRVRATPPLQLGDAALDFQDPRLATLLLRFRARNWRQHLRPHERQQWDAWRHQRLTGDAGLSEHTLVSFRAEIVALRERHAGDSRRLDVLSALSDWGDAIEAGLAPAALPALGDRA